LRESCLVRTGTASRHEAGVRAQASAGCVGRFEFWLPVPGVTIVLLVLHPEPQAVINLQPFFLGIVLGSAFLFAFYRAIQFQWPDSYFAAGDTVSYAISVSPIRYLAFRLLPIYATCVFVVVTLNRLHAAPLIAVIAIGVIYASPTGRSVLRDARADPTIRRHRAPVLVLRVITILGIQVVAILAFASRGVMAPLVPSVHDVVVTLWTAAIAGILGAYAIQASRGRTANAQKLANRSANSIPSSLWDSAKRIAEAGGADPTLVKAIMIAENLQRPRWFRHLERLKSRLSPEGTYGIMQVSSSKWLTDQESIRKAVATRLRGVTVRNATGEVDYEKLRSVAMLWNPDPTFVDLLWSAWWEATER
jgi:hypothetical protein